MSLREITQYQYGVTFLADPVLFIVDGVFKTWGVSLCY